MTAPATALPEIRAAGDVFSRFAVRRRLGRPAGRVEIFAVHGVRDGQGELLVAERLPGKRADHAEAEADARALMGLRHPNLATVRDVARADDALWVVSDFVEGGTLDDLKRVAKKPLTLELGLRVVVDVLAALSALHGHASKLVHGWINPRSVIVGLDGITRLAHAWLGRSASIADPDAMSYMAPELLRGGELDGRADVFSVGALLWEIAMGRRLFPAAPKDKLLARLEAGGSRLPKATPPAAATWAIPLSDVIEKALSTDPAGRYATTAEMAAAVRLIVRAKLAMPSRVAGWVDANAGERIVARRAELALPPELMPRRSRPSLPDNASRVLDGMRPPSKPPKATPSVPPVAIPQAPAVPRPIGADAKPRPALQRPPTPKPLAPPTAVEPEPISVEPISLNGAFEPEPEADASAEIIAVGGAPAPRAAPPIVDEKEPTIVAPEAPAVDIAPLDAHVEREAATVRRPKTEADRRRRGIVLVVSGVCAVIVVLAFAKWTWVRLTAPSAPSATPSAAAIPTVVVTTPATPATTAPPPPTVTTPATAETASAEPSTSATTAPPPTARPKPRPKSTYDPQGI